MFKRNAKNIAEKFRGKKRRNLNISETELFEHNRQ